MAGARGEGVGEGGGGGGAGGRGGGGGGGGVGGGGGGQPRFFFFRYANFRNQGLILINLGHFGTMFLTISKPILHHLGYWGGPVDPVGIHWGFFVAVPCSFCSGGPCWPCWDPLRLLCGRPVLILCFRGFILGLFWDPFGSHLSSFGIMSASFQRSRFRIRF